MSMYTQVTFNVYRQFKMSIYLESYFSSMTNKHIRDVFIRFRVGASQIRTHKLRYVQHTPEDPMCPLCNKCCPEDEIHFLFHCDRLNDLRYKYISRKYYVHPSLVNFVTYARRKLSRSRKIYLSCQQTTKYRTSYSATSECKLYNGIYN